MLLGLIGSLGVVNRMAGRFFAESRQNPATRGPKANYTCGERCLGDRTLINAPLTPHPLMTATATTVAAAPENLSDVLRRLGRGEAHGSEFSRRQAAIVAFGRRTIARPSVALLMQDAVALVGEILETELAGIGEVIDGHRLLMTIGALDEGGRMISPASKQFPLDETSSLAAKALVSGAAVMANNLAEQSDCDDAFLRGLGVTSALVVPIHLDHEPLGTLGVYYSDERQFEKDDIGFAESISHLLASTVARDHAEKSARRESRFSESLVGMVDSLVAVVDGEGRVLRINRACQSSSGFSSEEIAGKPFGATLLTEEQLPAFKHFLRGVHDGVPGCQFEATLVTKEGQHRQVRWTGERIQAGRNGAEAELALAGSDRTEELAALEQLEQANEKASKAVDLLAEVRRRVAEGQPVDELLGVQADRVGRGQSPPLPANADPDGGDRNGLAAAPAARQAWSDEEPRPFQQVGQPKGAEMRGSPRRSYQYRQLIAPMLDDKLPSRKNFFEVVCQDISASGISFVLDNEPHFERVVVALGKPPRLTFFAAEVARVQPQELDGREKWIVGCRFVGRVKG